MALSETERETIIGMTDADDIAYVYTCQKPMITKLKRNPAVRIIEEGEHCGTPFLKCELPSKLINIRKPTTMTAEQRAARSETMRQTRARQLQGQEELF